MKLYEILDLALKGALNEMEENEYYAHLDEAPTSYEQVGHREYIRACKDARDILEIIIGAKDIEDRGSEE